jgi:hypothetical protein
MSKVDTWIQKVKLLDNDIENEEMKANDDNDDETIVEKLEKLVNEYLPLPNDLQ